MKIKDIGDEILVTLNSSDVWAWQNRSGSQWPCATISGAVWARFDRHGNLVDTNAGEDVDETEFNAIFSDMIAAHRPDHPVIRGEVEPFNPNYEIVTPT